MSTTSNKIKCEKSSKDAGIKLDIHWKLNVEFLENDLSLIDFSDVIDSTCLLKVEISASKGHKACNEYQTRIFGKQLLDDRCWLELYYLSYEPRYHGRCKVAINNEEFTSITSNQEVAANILYQLCVVPLAYGKEVHDIDIKVHLFLRNEPAENVTGNSMNGDLKSFINNKTLSDVELKSNDGKEYNVHKVILAARSPVLKAHFDHNTTECHTNIIETVFDSEVLEAVITFMYTDSVVKPEEFPENLFVAADYYQIALLKNHCIVALHKKLTIDNAIETLQFADKYSEESLKLSTLEFIKGAKIWPLIMKTEGWKALDSIELMKTMLEYLFCKNNQ